MSLPDTDATQALRDAIAVGSDTAHYLLRLFISGNSPKSSRAIHNIRALCEEKLHGRYHLEVIDILQHPEYAGAEHILVAPTLIKKLPLPHRRILGDLSDKSRVLIALDIVARDVTAAPGGDRNA